MQQVVEVEQKEKSSRDLLFLVGAFIVASCLLTYSLFQIEVITYKNEKLSFNTYKVPLYGWVKQISEVLEEDKKVTQ